MTSTIVVLSDLHSRRAKAEEALTRVGVLVDGERQPGFQIVQVGDAVSAGYGMLEVEFYEWWTGLLEEGDVELVGNHEVPILWPYDDRFKFYGYMAGDMDTAGCDPALVPLVLARKDRYVAAHAVDDWLITHAGVIKRYQFGDRATDTANHLNELWRRHRSFEPHPIRGCAICDYTDGVLWARNLEKMGNEPAAIPQIFGHTPDGPTLGRGGTMWNIDTPRLKSNLPRSEAEAWGGVSALVRVDGAWELTYVQ